MHPKVTVEFHFESNWLLDSTAQLFYLDDAGAEVLYQTLAQGAVAQQRCHAGNAWRVRGAPSRETYAEHVASAAPLQIVRVGAAAPTGAPAGLRTVWALGRAPREELVFAVRVLRKLLGNIRDAPTDAAVRVVRRANGTIARLLTSARVVALLDALGFVAAGAAGELLELPPAFQIDEATMAALARLERCLHGLEGVATAPTTGGSDAPAASGDGRSHTCAACAAGITNDVRLGAAARRRAAGGVDGWRSHEWNAAGEYRYRCAACAVDLCAACYDRFRAGDASAHALGHALEIVAPITTPWGRRGGYGAGPPTPSLSARPRRGPWG